MRPALACCIAMSLALALGACSGGSKHSKRRATTASPCPLVARLDETAASVARADVSDPDAFKRTLDHAVNQYVATVRELQRLAPPDLKPELDRMEAAVHQYRFQDAATARVSLDAYAATACGRALPSASGRASTTTPGPPATTKS